MSTETADELIYLREELARAHQRYDALVEKLVTMKREGFQTVETVAVPELPSLPKTVEEAIAQRSEPASATRRELARAASALLARGLSEQAVSDLVLSGEEIEL